VRTTSATPAALEIRRLTKRYGARLALGNVDLVVSEGTILGLLGPNGAGKTTLMRIVLGLVHADAGTIRIAGDPHAGGKAVGAGLAGLVDVPGFYRWLSGRQNLELLARLDRTTAAAGGDLDLAIAAVGLSAAANTHVAHYSAGMRQRLAIAGALVRSPRLLLLDEPTSFLDPAGARDVRALVRRLASEGVAVVFSSHDLADVESLCPTVTILDEGRVRFCGSVEDLRAATGRRVMHLRTSDDEWASRIARQRTDIVITPMDEGGNEVGGDLGALDRYVVALGQTGIAVRLLEPHEQTLEMAFLEMTASLRDAPTHEGAEVVDQPVAGHQVSQTQRHSSIGGMLAAARVEWTKVWAERWVQTATALCLVAPWAFVLAIRLQDSVPEDTLFGRGVKESGFAVPLVVLGFASTWVLPAAGALVAGDIFSMEDRYGTWSSILTRSRSRWEVFAGKVVVAAGWALLLVAALGLSSIVAGLVAVGYQPLIDLSGGLMEPWDALIRTTLAWTTVVPPVFAFAGAGLLLSVWSRRGTAGIGVPVLAGLLLQLYAFVNGPDAMRRLVITSSFDAWHGLINQHPYYRPLVDSTLISAGYCVVSVVLSYRIFRTRDIT
jgi:ABC-type multidrug transport system ATPase subunit/ABC-type transport system involved in multi-copper enzyme maturation permease subunit